MSARLTKWGYVTMDSNSINDSLFQQFVTGAIGIKRRGKFLIDHAEPLFCAEVLIRNITSKVEELTEAPFDETVDEARERFQMAREYMQVWEYLMGIVERDVFPALERLHKLEYPDETEGEK